jgi:hypothetical protein
MSTEFAGLLDVDWNIEEFFRHRTWGVNIDDDEPVPNLPHPYLRDIVPKLAAARRELRSFSTHYDMPGF